MQQSRCRCNTISCPGLSSCSVLRNIFLVSCVLLACSALFPVLWHLWIYAGSANSNFYYAITLLFNVAQVGRSGQEQGHVTTWTTQVYSEWDKSPFSCFGFRLRVSFMLPHCHVLLGHFETLCLLFISCWDLIFGDSSGSIKVSNIKLLFLDHTVKNSSSFSPVRFSWCLIISTLSWGGNTTSATGCIWRGKMAPRRL